MQAFVIFILALTAEALSLTKTTRLSLDVPYQKPAIAVPISGKLFGLSIEHDRWNDWTGNLSHPNDFTYRLLDNLKKKTGVAAPIRIGGGTQDGLIWDDTVNGVINQFPPIPTPLTSTKQLFPQCSSGRHGGDWFLLARNLPAGTNIIWGINFHFTPKEAIDQIRALEKSFQDPRLKDITLESIEVGNEPDKWGNTTQPSRPPNWDIDAYVARYSNYFTEIEATLGSSRSRKYQVGSFATWSTRNLSETVFFNSSLAKSTVSLSEHNYSNRKDVSVTAPSSAWPGFRAELLTKSNVRGNITKFGVSAAAAHQRGLKFYIGELNSMFAHGQPGVSNAAVAGVWVVDYVLHAAASGIDGLHFHHGIGYYYNSFQPINFIGPDIFTSDPKARRHVQPLYTGFVVLADIIGKSKKASVSEIPVKIPEISAYAIWDGGNIDKIVLVNFVAWEGGPGRRPAINVELPSFTSIPHAKYKTLSIPSLGAYNGLTWGGQSYETYSGLPSGHETFQRLKGNSIGVKASSVVVVYL